MEMIKEIDKLIKTLVYAVGAILVLYALYVVIKGIF